ncbi:uncharacterized protein LOC131629320 [Vicia villosa]|uniref:uncharacterized protein LOC131629320 n=1 Tax=Vicia villosa TaxID=3911 RepID=UPI00273A91E4|nr:uncharacterized protein LOC131629320 [Vicia villosa]
MEAFKKLLPLLENIENVRKNENLIETKQIVIKMNVDTMIKAKRVIEEMKTQLGQKRREQLYKTERCVAIRRRLEEMSKEMSDLKVEFDLITKQEEEFAKEISPTQAHMLRMIVDVIAVSQATTQIKKEIKALKDESDTLENWATDLQLELRSFQRGHDETRKSRNQGNFLELLKLLASYNDEIAKVVLENAPQNCKYTSHQIQKELLQILSSRVKKSIREEIGDSKFCIVVDEARDESKKEQMALVLRFVDKVGLIQEIFFDVAHVKDTTSLTLKEAIYDILSRHNLDVSNIRGQGYDGASNMRGEWNGLQALFMKDCPYAYYVHCFAHRLQLALVTSSREVKPVHNFFEKMIFIVNVVCSFTKRHDKLQASQLEEIAHLLEIDEIVTSKGSNQVVTLKRAGDTRW